MRASLQLKARRARPKSFEQTRKIKEAEGKAARGELKGPNRTQTGPSVEGLRKGRMGVRAKPANSKPTAPAKSNFTDMWN